jgi:hypothetical protein
VAAEQSDFLRGSTTFVSCITAAHGRVPGRDLPDKWINDKERRTGKYRPTTGSGQRPDYPRGCVKQRLSLVRSDHEKPSDGVHRSAVWGDSLLVHHV